MRAADLKHPEVVAGMAAVVALVKEAGAISSETCGRFNDEENVTPDNWVDGRDYGRMAYRIEATIRQNVVDGAPKRREGFLLALADMFALLGDGCGVSDDWDPRRTIERAVRGQAAAARRNRG